MPTRRPVAAGVLAVPVVAGATLATSPTAVLVAGVPVGVIVGFLSDGWLEALLNGVLAGVGIGLAFLAVGWYVVTEPERAAPGIGIALLLVTLAAGALCVQSALAAPVSNVLKP